MKMKSINPRLRGVDVSVETNISLKRAPVDEDEIYQSKILRLRGVDVSVETNISLKRAPAAVEASHSCSPQKQRASLSNVNLINLAHIWDNLGESRINGWI